MESCYGPQPILHLGDNQILSRCGAQQGDALTDLAGSPLSDWAWRHHYQALVVASTLGGPPFMLQQPTSAPLPSLVDYILECDHPSSNHLASSISSLANAAERPDWTSLEEIDTPLHQCPLSYCIDEAVYNQLLSAAPDTRSRAVVLSTSLPHAGDWLNVVPSSTLGLHLQDKEFRLCLQY